MIIIFHIFQQLGRKLKVSSDFNPLNQGLQVVLDILQLKMLPAFSQLN